MTVASINIASRLASIYGIDMIQIIKFKNDRPLQRRDQRFGCRCRSCFRTNTLGGWMGSLIVAHSICLQSLKSRTFPALPYRTNPIIAYNLSILSRTSARIENSILQVDCHCSTSYPVLKRIIKKHAVHTSASLGNHKTNLVEWS